MAEINVVRKRPVPIWAWLLAGIALFLLIWLLWGALRPGYVTRNRMVLTDPVTDVLVLVDTPDRRSLLGRQVQLSDVSVRRVTGDKTFWIGPSDDKQLLVVLNEEPTPGSSVEGRYNIEPGQTVDITGAMIQLPDADTARTLWGEAVAREAADDQVYLRANQVKIHE